MTTTYTFPALYTRAGVSASPTSLPTVSVISSDNTLLVNAQNATALTNLLGNYYYSYSGADDLICWAIFHTTDTTVDQQDIGSYTPTTVIANQVWDEVLTAATHNVPTSAGRRLRQLAPTAILDGIITGATTNSVTFNGDASTTDGAYDPAAITIMSGSGIGQTRLILQYDGAAKKAWLDRDWKVIPENGDTCVISSEIGREHVNEGVLRSGSALAVQLNALASSTDNAYIGQTVFLRSGTGADQAFKVTGYNGTTKVVTTRKPLNPIPDNTTTYVMLPTGELDVDRLSDNIWSNSNRTLTSISSHLSGIANAVWTYIRRTLGDGTSVGEADAYEIDAIRGDTLEYIFTDIDLTDYDSAYFTVKTQYKDSDSSAIIQVHSGSGLLCLNGVSASISGSLASLVLDSANEQVTLTVESDVMDEILYKSSNYVYDLQLVSTTSGSIYTPQIGTFVLVRDVTNAIQ